MKKFILAIVLIIISITLIIGIQYSSKNNSYEITGTYQLKGSSFNSLVFDNEINEYYLYTLDENDKGNFKKENDNIYITNGPYKDYRVEVYKDYVLLIRGKQQMQYDKVSSIPTINE